MLKFGVNIVKFNKVSLHYMQLVIRAFMGNVFPAQLNNKLLLLTH